MNKQYHILVGIDSESPIVDAAPYEMIFGDYDKELVKAEKADTYGYTSLRIITLLEDTDAAVYAALDKLNVEASA